MKTAYVFFADGCEDVEAITPVDYLRRAEVSVSVVGLSARSVTTARGLTVGCDATLAEVSGRPLPDLAVLPGGGKGSHNLAASAALRDFIGRMLGEGRLVGAICAAPALTLGDWGFLKGRRFTCFPGMGENLPTAPLDDRVVVDKNVITARAAGTAEEFSLALIGSLCGAAAAKRVASDILAR
jgi:4-methyl-5(b-hydroxyethyl)-thiazole monophosphate biosynthesis